MLLAYDRVEYPRRAKLPGTVSPTMNFGESKTYSGELTQCAKKRLKRAITLITATAKPKKAMSFKTNSEFTFKLNFITLTLPCPQGNRSDKEVKKEVLDVWIKAAKRRFDLKSYVWRAERQKNGNIHFHMITDVYIPYDQLRDTWNDRLNRLGYIDKFEEKHKHRHPNSTDVHAIKNIKNLASYFMKYMAKDAEEGDQIEGKLWDCSANLKQKHNCEMLIDTEEMELIRKADADPEVQRKDLEFSTCWFLPYHKLKKIASNLHMQKYEEWLESIRNPPEKFKKDTDQKNSNSERNNNTTKSNPFAPKPKKSKLKQENTTQQLQLNTNKKLKR